MASRSRTGRAESVAKPHRRYGDIDECFPDEVREAALPYFVDWLLENVHLVEITAYSDDDAYTIFETMNDRGLSLTPDGHAQGLPARQHRRPRQTRCVQITLASSASCDLAMMLGKEVEPDCFKAWLRSQYATKIRERKQGRTARGLRPHRHRVPPLGAEQRAAIGPGQERRLLPLHRPRLRLLSAASTPRCARPRRTRSPRPRTRSLQRPARLHAPVHASARAAETGRQRAGSYRSSASSRTSSTS